MVITESALRRLALQGKRALQLRAGDILTPAARDYLRQQNFAIQPAPADVMSREPVPMPGGAPLYTNEAGQGLRQKPEHMTQLHGATLVDKGHPRIALRGSLDLLQAEILCAQVQALEHGWNALGADLGEALAYTRQVLGCEVKQEPFPAMKLFGYTAAELRERSHHPELYFGIPHLVPDAAMGPVVAGLNRLRAEARRCELAAVAALRQEDGSLAQPDLLQALNRLSSGFYILMCRMNSGFYSSLPYGSE